MNEVLNGQQRAPLEWGFTSTENYKDPFNEIELDVIVVDELGQSWTVPAFWSGRSEWKIRFSAPHTGTYTYESVCTNKADAGLNGQKGRLQISAYTGSNPLYIHGPVRVMKNGRYFEHEDGTPFAWLGDTWHPLFTSRINSTDEVQLLAKDRAEKGFTLIEVVNGLLCDVQPGDERLKNEGGFPWTGNFDAINPAYYELADQKIKAIVDNGLAVAMTGSWGMYIEFLGVEKMKKHFRNMVARYAAYPVFWILAGETIIPAYDIVMKGADTPEFQAWIIEAKIKWTKLLSYLKELDPFRNLITTHVMHEHLSVDEVEKPELLDFVQFQAGVHDEVLDSISHDVKHQTKRGYELDPVRPVVNGESPYEGMLYHCRSEVQRWFFWHSMLGGCAGWTYGASGMFNASHKDKPFGTAHYGICWGEQTWQEAYQFEGSKHVGNCRKFLNKYEWWKLKPAPDKVSNPENASEWTQSVAAEIPGELIIAYYQPHVSLYTMFGITGISFKNLNAGDRYKVIAYNPIRDYEIDRGEVVIGEDGTYTTGMMHTAHDWVYILKKV